MNVKKIFIALVLISLVLFFGCTTPQYNVCGDGVCSLGEENTCESDCGPIVETGTLVVEIEPSANTTIDDLNSLKGAEVSICSFDSTSCKSEVINTNLRFKINNYPEGVYYFSVGEGILNSNGVPISLDSSKVVYFSNESDLEKIGAVLGVKYNLSVESNGVIIPASNIELLDYHEVNSYNYYEYVDYTPNGLIMGWEQAFGENPFNSVIYLDSSSKLELQLFTTYYMTLKYNGVVKDFNYQLVQGENSIVLDFD